MKRGRQNGFDPNQAAFELGISGYTAQISPGHIMRKMEADSFASLVKLASRLKLEPTGTPNKNK
jgi:FixJ family two-component response regulator